MNDTSLADLICANENCTCRVNNAGWYCSEDCEDNAKVSYAELNESTTCGCLHSCCAFDDRHATIQAALSSSSMLW